MKRLLAGVILLSGCGSNTTPSPLSGGGLNQVRGPQRVRFVSVAYQDTPAPPYGDEQLNALAALLDQTVRRNSGAPSIGADIGRPGAWVQPEFQNITLPGDQALYNQTNYKDLSGQPINGPLALDCLATSPAESVGFPFRVFLTPHDPPIYLGYAAVAAGFCSDAYLGVSGLPVNHEFGHMLGMQHDLSPGFIMYPDTISHWEEDYSRSSKNRVGWP